jgi:hypothetical protein
MHRLGLLPAELLALPVWCALNGQTTATRAPLRLRMVLAWDGRHDQPLAWGALVREAHSAAARPSKRFVTWPMLEVA